ncbi:hypothetical protein HY485_03005 [Candidatus Woesearchaeota archaeon]|nr:hypothetical protein [Candidatus Woesearchaeota archaeon]
MAEDKETQIRKQAEEITDILSAKGLDSISISHTEKNATYKDLARHVGEAVKNVW